LPSRHNAGPPPRLLCRVTNLDQGFRRARVPFSVCFGCGEMEQPDDRDPIALQQVQCKFFVQSAGVHARKMPD
jgi:hypothetical protein